MKPAQAVVFTVPGRIGGKGRHRAFIRDGKIKTYTPGKTANQEALIRHFAAGAMYTHDLLQGPLGLSIEVYRLAPKSWSEKKRASATWVTGKPDADNTIKLCSDSMNGIVYRDDSQIATIYFAREYVLEGPEKIDIEVEELTR